MLHCQNYRWQLLIIHNATPLTAISMIIRLCILYPLYASVEFDLRLQHLVTFLGVVHTFLHLLNHSTYEQFK